MKKVIAMLCLSVLFFSACQKEGTVRLRVQVVPPASDEKVYIDGTNHAWFHMGDKILINGLAYRMSSPDGSGVYFVDVDEDMLNANPASYDVFYPATGASYSVANHTYSLLLKSNQQYYVEDASGTQKLEAVMAGSVNADESTITLHNVTSLLRVKIPPSFVNLISITVTAGDGTSGHNDLMSGQYTVAMNATNGPTMTKNTGKGPSVILTCPNGTCRTDRTYYVVLPPTLTDDTPNPVQYKVTIFGEVMTDVEGVPTRVKAYAEVKQNRPSVLRANHIGNVEFFDGDVHVNALPYLYTVAVDGSGNPTKKVRFSTGTLQYKYSGTHFFASSTTGTDVSNYRVTGTTTGKIGTWRFSPHQYDICGKDANEKIASLSSNPNVWIDLFGYGTSQSPVSGMQPFFCTGQHNDYGCGTGSGATMDFDSDWGRNQISNADNSLPWYTLHGSEWLTLVSQDNNISTNPLRYNCNSLGTIKLNGGGEVHGAILLPDSSGIIGWNEYLNPLSCKAFVPCAWNTTQKFAANVYTEGQWAEMEALGAIFLPCTGRRGTTQEATDVTSKVNEVLFFWTSDGSGLGGSYGNTSGEVSYDNGWITGFSGFSTRGVQKNRANGLSVRLAFEVPSSQW